jgi:hypothetical protein
VETAERKTSRDDAGERLHEQLQTCAQSLGRGVTPSRVADDDDGGSQVVRVSATLTVPEAARLLGIGRNLAYDIAARDGEIAGVPVIRVGRRLLIPLARLLEVLGLDDDSTRFEPKR